ncbi:holo-ACP synthase [uncultured Ruminococcus sp.]|uniref:holo-ACP synthase n=1 Tax=uncultured Ruminococcus sp. TaxID=165186 RepID=UPI0025F0CACB|nr:holo-ACP synthase [uncultured Ruminococcus sp.]
MGKYTVGTDLVEIQRIKDSCQRRRFIERVYSEKESALFSSKKDPYPSMAGNWAAKEAFSKALCTGVRGFELHEVSVLRDELGCPYLELSGKAADTANRMGVDFSVSITHTKDYASAVVIAFPKEDN